MVNLSANDAANRPGWRVRLALRQVGASGRVLIGRAGSGCLYISVNSGTAALLDVPLVAAARIRRRKVFVHHHSFRYIDSPTRTMRLFYGLGGQYLTDIALCERMASGLANAYQRSDVRIVPNVVDLIGERLGHVDGDVVQLGHLSNLSIEKGVGRVIDAFAKALGNGANVQLHLAGPYASEDARKAVESAVAKWPGSVFYHGPLYDQAKDEFYSKLDLFLYPTDYVVEAQPLVLLEALGAGVHVISVDRGCIGNLGDVASPDVVTIGSLEEFPDLVGQAVQRINGMSPAQREASRGKALNAAIRFEQGARRAFSALVDEILAP